MVNDNEELSSSELREDLDRFWESFSDGTMFGIKPEVRKLAEDLVSKGVEVKEDI